ncbi:MAG: hypothetical protein OES13_04460 [Acidimicrobiia bacterium]|nr:hypothetical protein [Acidimicrobiia bacterium]
MSRINFRRISPLLALATAAAVTLTLAPALAQSEGAAPDGATAVETAALPAMLMQLSRSDSLVTGTWEMTVGDVFAAASPVRSGYSEVRIGLNMKNVGDADAGYRVDGFFTDPAYPRLAIVDGRGRDHRLLPEHSTRALLPGSTLSAVPPGMTARWTVGFQVPTARVDDLELTVTGVDGSGSFDLGSAAAATMTAAPAATPAVSIGDEINWGDELSVSAFDHGSLVCGEPNTQLATQIIAVGFEVGNRTATDVDWPGVRFPENLAIAQWADGTSARMAFETFVGDFDPLLKWAEDAVRIPAGGDGAETHKRAMLFAAPRDARLAAGNVSDAPIGIWLRPQGTDPVWLELDGPGTLAMTPSLCDEGNFNFTIPFAFGPGADFVVGLADVAPDPVDQDLAARQMLSEALVVAGNFRVNNGGSYDGMTAGGLAALWNGLSYSNGFVGTVGSVGVSTVQTEAGDIFGILVTESASGQFFCMADGPTGVTTQGAPSLAELELMCSPAAAVAEVVEEAAVAETP